MQIRNHTIRSGNLKLEARIHWPGTGGPEFPGVVICHPHPLYGGDMNNNVVMALCEHLCKSGILAMRFNFRGVGMSEGSYDDARGEQDDLHAALESLAHFDVADSNRLGVAGYSFGGMVALSACSKSSRIKALAAISPVINPSGLPDGIRVPSFFIVGTGDHVLSADFMKEEAEKMPSPVEVHIIEGVDHFWGGHEHQMAAAVAGFFAAPDKL